MNYDDGGYQNPPAVVSAPVPIESNVLANEEFEDPSKKQKEPKTTNDRMNLKHAIFSTGKSEGISTSARSIFDVLMHICFLIVMVYVSFIGVSNEAFYYRQIMTNTLTNKEDSKLADVAHMDNIWDFMQNTLLPGLYWDEVEAVDSEEGMVLFENKLLGVPTLRSLKVNNQSCVVADSFKREIKECFGAFSESVEDVSPIVVNNITYEWQSATDLSTLTEYGTMNNYAGGGVVVRLPYSSIDGAKQLLNDLKDARFIERGTRAIFADFALYNGNVNLFASIRIIFELPPTGGVRTRARIDVMNLFRYNSNGGTVIMAFEGLFVGFVAFLIIEEIVELLKKRLSYFTSFWNLMDLAIILAIVSIILSYNRTRIAKNRVNSIIESSLTWAPMDEVVAAMSCYQNWASVLLFLAWIKMFKFISVNRTMSQLSDTLTRSSKDIGGFAVMFSVFYFAYAQFGYLIFGTQIEDYSTFYSASMALLRTILGDFDYNALQNANRILGPIFFITYIFFVFFILLNMFLAIINDAYVEVKAELDKKKDASTVVDWIQGRLGRMVSKKHGVPDSPDESSMVTYDLYKAELIKAGYREKDILAAYTKLDIGSDDLVTEKGMEKVAEEIREAAERRVTIDRENEKLNVMNRRVEALETALGNSARRLDTVLRHIADAEKRRAAVAENNARISVQEFLRSKPHAE